MSIDEAVLCGAHPAALASYLEREGVPGLELPKDDSWGGSAGGAFWWLESRDAWDEEDRRRYDRWLGRKAVFKVGINYRGSSLRDGTKAIVRVARRIAHETEGIYVSLDEER